MKHIVRAALALLALTMGGPALMAAEPTPTPKAAAPATSSTQAVKLSEMQKIDALIKIVETSSLTFIRNGSAYDSKKAAAHLRDKINYALKRGNKPDARLFIKEIASKSYLTKRPYLIREKDGKEIPAGEWLTKRLVELEQGKRPIPGAKEPTPAAPDKAPAAPARPVSK